MFPHVCTVKVDPNPASEGVTGYNFYLGNVLVTSSPTPQANVTVPAPGLYTFGVSAVNVWTEGPQTQLQVAAVPPSPPANLVVIP